LHSGIEDDYGDAFHNDWISLGHEDIYFSSYIFVDNELPLCGLFSIDDLCDNCVGGGNTGEDKEGDEHYFEQVPSFTKAYCLHDS
jgi:hypothetical protein